jgi:hypothetical protein
MHHHLAKLGYFLICETSIVDTWENVLTLKISTPMCPQVCNLLLNGWREPVENGREEADRVAGRMIEHLPSKCEALGSDPNIVPPKKDKECWGAQW